MRDYKNIKAWQLADRLVLRVYSLTKAFPKDELYGLTSQLRRAVISVAANISEGAGRQHKKEYLNFLYISRGSLIETEYLLSVANRLNYMPNSRYEEILPLITETQSTLYGLIQAVQSEL